MQEITLVVPDSVTMMRENNAVTIRERQLLNMQELLVERLAALELPLEDDGWERLGQSEQREFSRAGLQRIIDRARLMYLSNPLIGRGVDVKANYVFGQGVEFEADDPAVNDVVQRFLSDPKNRVELSSHQAMTLKEIDLAVEGNIFFAFFSEPVKGQTRIRTLPVNEVTEIICNPEDAKEPWFYRRVWNQQNLNGRLENMEALYPDVQLKRTRQQSLGGKPILWDIPVKHVKIGGLSSMRFGVPETYRAHDWAKAYKEALEDRATFARALSRFAQKLTMQTSAAGIAAAKDRLQTTYPNGGDRNPPPGVGSTFIGRKDSNGNVVADVEAIKLGGATLPVDNERPFRLQVAAALGLPETFFGDADVGNHATSKTLDRPTELMMMQRRQIWGDVFSEIFDFIIRKAVQAPSGPLRSKYRLIGNGDSDPYQVIAKTKQSGEVVQATVRVTWPPLLEHDKATETAAIVAAAPWLGEQMVSRMLMSLFGEDDLDEKITELYGSTPDTLPRPVAPPPSGGQPPMPPQDAAFTEAIREVRDALRRLAA